MEAFFEEARGQETPWKFARVLRPAIRRNIKLAESPSFGQTIFDYAPDAPGAADYAALGAALLRDWDSMLAKRAAEKGVPQVIVTPQPSSVIPSSSPPGRAAR